MEEKAVEQFNRLKPVCVQVMKAPTTEALALLQEKLSQLDDTIPPNMADYVAFPLKIILKQRKELLKETKFLENLLLCIATLWNHTTLASVETMLEFFQFFCVLLDPSLSSQAGLPTSSEDLQAAVLTALRSLLWSSDTGVSASLYVDKCLPMLGHCVSAVLSMLQSNTSRQVKLLCLDNLAALSGLRVSLLALIPRSLPPVDQPREAASGTLVGGDHSGPVSAELDDEPEGMDSQESLPPSETSPSSDAALSSVKAYLDATVQGLGVSATSDDCSVVASHALASFFPGIVLNLAKIITGDSKVGSLLISAAILALTRFIAVTLPSRCTIECNSEPDREQPGLKSESDDSAGLRVTRDQKWLTETSDKVSTVLTKVLGQVVHPSWRVRVALVAASHILLCNCSASLSQSVLPCCELLIALSEDDRAELALMSTFALRCYSLQLEEETRVGGQKLVFKIEESLLTLCSSLKGLLVRQSDSEKLAVLRLLAGYIKLLGPQMMSLVNSHTHFSMLLQALLTALQLDTSDLGLMEERMDPTLSEPAVGSTWNRRLQYTLIHSSAVEGALLNVCTLLGYHCPILPLVEFLLEIFQSKPIARKEAVLILNRVVVGAAERMKEETTPREKEVVAQKVKHLLEVYLQPEHWNVAVNISAPRDGRGLEIVKAEQQKRRTVKEVTNNVIFLSLLLDGVKSIAVALGRKFNPLLQIAMYPLLQKLGDFNAVISQSAFSTLQTVCHECGYSSLTELLKSNADYLVNSICLKLRHLDLYPEATVALSALLQHGGTTVLPLVTDSVDELVFALDLYQEDQMELIWPVLQTTAEVIAAKVEDSVPTVEATLDASTCKVEPFTPSDAVAFFNNAVKLSMPAVSEDDSADAAQTEDCAAQTDEEPVPDYIEEAKTKKQLPHHLRLSVTILDRAAHYLPSPSSAVRVTVLTSIAHAVRALRFDQSSLLPQVHILWPSFVKRFGDSGHLVAAKAVEVLHVLCQVCRDFLRKRVSKEIWPTLTSRLKALASESSNAGKLYFQSQRYKLQRAILSHVGYFSRELELSSVDLELLIHACVPYLSRDQPDILRQHAMECLRALIHYEADVLWAVLSQLSLAEMPSPPHPSLKPFRIMRVTNAAHFSQCADELLKEL